MSTEPQVRVIVESTIEALLKPLFGLIEKIAGPATEEVGLTLRDHIRVYRARRLMDLLAKTGEYIRLAGYTPREVTKKLLLPIMDYSSIEDDEYLHDTWAALLANAAKPQVSEPMPSYFPEILRQLTHDQAVFLDALYQDFLSTHGARPSWSTWNFKDVLDIYVKSILPETVDLERSAELLEMQKRQLRVATENLERLGLLGENLFSPQTFTLGPHMQDRLLWDMKERESRYERNMQYYITETGLSFIEACHPPSGSRSVNQNA